MTEHAMTAFMAMSIPIIAIVMGIGIGMLSLVLDFRKKREMFAMHHKERMAAIEKGMEVPPLPPEFFQDGRRRNCNHPGDQLRSGLVLLLVGGALCAALYVTQHEAWVWGLIPAAVGIAKLAYYGLIGRRLPATGPGTPGN
jgi:hypothetical protein